MKKFLFAILMAILLPCVLLAGSVEGLYQIESDVYKSASALCIANGVLPPAQVSPVLGSDILSALEAIPESRLDENELRLIASIREELTGDMMWQREHVGMDPHVRFSPEIYAQTEKLEKQWDHPYDVEDMMPFFDFGFDMELDDYAYAFGDWVIASPGLDSLYDKTFMTNLDQKMEFQHEGVMNAGLLVGTDLINAGVYRTRQEFGSGKTGNLMVGDNFSRQDFARLNLRTPWIRYTGNFTRFDQERLRDDRNDMPWLVNGSYPKSMFNGWQTYQGIHRFDLIIRDNLSFTVQEGLMLHTENNFDLRLVNPFTYLHGFFNFGANVDYNPETDKNGDEANNYMSLELGWTIVPHLSMNIQFLMDQLQLPGEGTGKNALPHAYAALWNFESPWIVDDHYITAWYEGAFVMPYTYLNYKLTTEDGKKKYNTNLDMIVGNNNYLQQDFGYAGYTYGSDSIVNSLGLSFGMFGTYDVDFSFTYLIHGQYGLGYRSIIAERGPEHFTDMMLAGVGFENAEHRFILQLDGSYTPFDWLTVKSGIAFTSVINLGTVKGKSLNDLVFKLGVSFDPTEI